MNFELTFKDETKTQVKADSWNDLNLKMRSSDLDNVLKIEIVDAKIRRAMVKALNDKLSEVFTNEYYAKGTCERILSTILVNHGFSEELTAKLALIGKEGAIRNFYLGNEIYLTVTWYEMSSGNYEIVAYAS